jgi:hypothetical protein
MNGVNYVEEMGKGVRDLVSVNGWEGYVGDGPRF